ncbi:unnamed protein product [Fraxinus pennsylvanica]|uniref:RING-type E3 ubiquitin transferase n=1 Tax=Fraxinus pennsylvanica TaxID=56036 RepID=A0AAD1ZBZ6_9LAMI|nr:unnamed protein product [Fraxinus pennsylvanica]
MAFHHRKFLLVDKKTEDEKKYGNCYTCYYYISPPPPQLPLSPSLSPSPSPPPPPSPPLASPKHHMSTILILIICVLGATSMVISYLSIRRYRSRNPQWRNSVSLENSAREDFIDENQGPVVDHPIWYIRTVGLHQSIIDSIAVFKYKSGEGLIEENIGVSLDGGKYRVLSDLADHRAKVDRALQQTVRRSISMDFSSTSTICNTANVRGKKEEQNPYAASSIYRPIKSLLYVRSIQKVSISMKRFTMEFSNSQLYIEQ